MRWTPGNSDDNLEDRRGESGGGGGGFPGGGGGIKLGLGGTVIVLILGLVFGKDFTSILGSDGGDPTTASGNEAPQAARATGPIQSSAAEDKLVDFVKFLHNDTQETWRQIFASSGKPYRVAKLVLFRDATESACGFAQAATGPFYCPGDEKVYIDLGFYDELKNRFGAPGDFAQAYVLAHEFGHHVQKLLGTEAEMRRAQQQHPDQQNALSVKMELQADCYAGVWAFSAQQRNHIEPGDVEQGLAAAASVGDDRLQRMARGRVNPESFTHGTSAQRVEWFKRGLSRGSTSDCNTFGS
ncbi:MAG: neutral zinc metallopeptidase [Gemmatimonadaceae bacterium]